MCSCVWRCVYAYVYIFKALIISRSEDYEYIFFFILFYIF